MGQQRPVVAPVIGHPAAKGFLEFVRKPVRQFLRGRQYFEFAIAVLPSPGLAHSPT